MRDGREESERRAVFWLYLSTKLLLLASLRFCSRIDAIMTLAELREARRMSATSMAMNTTMQKPMVVSVGCQTTLEPSASDLGSAERRQLLARIDDLEQALAASNLRAGNEAAFGNGQTQTSRPTTASVLSWDHESDGMWEPAQSVFGPAQFGPRVGQHPSDFPSSRGSTPSLHPSSRGLTPDGMRREGSQHHLPPRSPSNSLSNLCGHSTEPRQPDEPPAGWPRGLFHEPAFGAAATGSATTVGGVGGALSTSAVSAMKGCLRSKVHVASQWLAELAAVSAHESDLPDEDTDSRHTSYLVLRYLTALSSLFVSLCNLPPRQEYLALFREMAAFIDGGAASKASTADKRASAAQATPLGQAPAPAVLPPKSVRRLDSSSDLSVAGRTALLGELNDLCTMLSPHAQNEVELLASLKRAVQAMRSELEPLLVSAKAPRTSAALQRASGPSLLSPGLRMTGNRGGGGGSDLHDAGVSWRGIKPWQQRHAIPTGLSHAPAWLARSESLPGMPDMALMRHSSSRAARAGRARFVGSAAPIK